MLNYDVIVSYLPLRDNSIITVHVAHTVLSVTYICCKRQII